MKANRTTRVRQGIVVLFMTVAGVLPTAACGGQADAERHGPVQLLDPTTYEPVGIRNDAAGTYEFFDGFSVVRSEIVSKKVADEHHATFSTSPDGSRSIRPRYVGATQHCWMIQEGLCGVKGCCFGSMCWEYAWDHGC